MPLYIADYLADTAHLNAAQSGAYLHLIMHYWQKGGLPQDEDGLMRIARMTPQEWKRNRLVIEAFFQPAWKHKRIDGELAHMLDVSSKRRAAAEQRHSKSDANAEQLDTHSHSHSQERKQDSKNYAFEAGVIRLNERDFSKWKAAFSYLDLSAELIGASKWAGEQADWFNAVSGLLAKRNREAKAAKERVKDSGFKYQSGIPGVV